MTDTQRTRDSDIWVPFPFRAYRLTSSRDCREQFALSCDRRRAEARGYLRARPTFVGLLRPSPRIPDEHPLKAHEGGPCPKGSRRLQPDGNLQEIGGLRDEVRREALSPNG